MKPIAITDGNRQRLEQLLLQVNDGASAHTATVADMFEAAHQAEGKLETLRIPRSQRAGAVVVHTSGSNVNSAYKYPRIVTTTVLRRARDGWLLVEAKRSHTSVFSRGGSALFLYPEQDATALAALRSNYTILPD